METLLVTVTPQVWFESLIYSHATPRDQISLAYVEHRLVRCARMIIKPAAGKHLAQSRTHGTVMAMDQGSVRVVCPRMARPSSDGAPDAVGP
jgi:hypothetical protein